jgi:general secretion pathway protein F
MAQPSASPVITLDHLIALGDEIAALSRAGLPLERGLAALGEDMPGGLGRVAKTLAQRAGRGQPLAAALDELGPRLPRACRAVVEAGIRAGRLPAALESLSAMLRRLADLRRTVAMALLYPMIVVGIAWALFAVFTAQVAPGLLEMLQSVGARGAGPLEVLVRWGRDARIWGPVGPAVLLLLAVLWWLAARRATLAAAPAATRLLGWLPWLGRSLRWSRAAAFADLLAVLVENGVPLDQSLRLAGQSCGDPRLAAAAEDMAESVSRGVAGIAADVHPRLLPHRWFPPLLAWLIARQGAATAPSLLPALRHASENYRRRFCCRRSRASRSAGSSCCCTA